MRKLFILILGFILVFGLVGVDKVSGCGCDDSSCTCDSNRCDSDSTTNCADLTTWYHSSSKSYTGLSYLNERSFKESDCVSNGECGPCCDGGEDCDGGCYTKYNCKSNYVTCQEWEDCSSPTSCGDRGNCDCNINYCKGWCKNRANEGEIPVYNGPNFSSCGSSAAGDCSFDGDYSKYESQSKGYTHTSYSTCTCSWCTIRKYHECDSSQIDDSHPCSSENCAPDFVGGRNYCCPEEHQCAHFGNVVSLSGYRYRDSSVNPDLYCYDSDSIVQYQGYKLKCNNGNWEFIGGEKADFTDNCGKTIFNYPLFFNSPDNNFYPDSYGYKDSYVIYPVSFEGTKDIVASVIPDETVKINGENVRYKVFREETGRFDVTFKGDEEGNQFDLTVNCYTPDKYNCDSSHDDCWPGSYCSQDNPTSVTIEESSSAKAKFEVRFLNKSNISCYLNGDEKIIERNNVKYVVNDDLTLKDHNIIACKVTTSVGKGGFEAQLKQKNPEITIFSFGTSTKWKYMTSEESGWKNVNHDDDSWNEGNQPFSDYPTNIYLRKNFDRNPLFFCCPNNSCAHKEGGTIKCYEEGTHKINVPGEDGSPCLWNCKNNRWGKQQEGAECEKDCDCADSDENYCVPTLHDLSKKICCNIGECGLGVESRCNKDSYCCPSGHSTIYKGNLCQCNAGSWTCSNTTIKTDYSRILFSKNSNKHETTLEVSETELRDINSANAKILVFFDKKDYDGDITITGLENCSSFISTTEPIDEKFEFDSSSTLSTDKGLNCRLKIEAPDLNNDEYFFYTGSTLVLKYIY